jgi:hypothetical protein
LSRLSNGSGLKTVDDSAARLALLVRHFRMFLAGIQAIRAFGEFW